MDSNTLAESLNAAVPGGAVEPFAAADGMPTLYVAREHVVAVCRELRDRPELRFALFVDMTAVDWLPREPRYEVVLHLAAPGVAGFGAAPKRLRVKVRVPGDAPAMPTLSGVWPAANWAEREVFDLFGITFDRHPDMRRILMPEEWDGYPARKDYPVQINMKPKVYEPLQVSAEEFAARVTAARIAEQD
jgi:NADH-quinone oxidoreductase subunit C